MNNKTLKVVGAVGLSLFAIVIVVTYTPKLINQLNKERKTPVSVSPLELSLTASELSLTASEKALAVLETWNQMEWDIDKTHTEKSTEVSVAIAKASETVKLSIAEFRNFYEENTLLKSVIETNIEANLKLKDALAALDEAMKALTKELQRPNEQKTHVHPPMKSMDAVLNAIRLLGDRLREVNDAHREYQRAHRIKARSWWFR